jgi:Tfp pilus assembly protein PilO
MRRFIPFIIAGLVAVTLVVSWFLLINQRMGSSKRQQQQELARLQDEKRQLEATIARRTELQRNEARTRAALVEFKQNIPDSPDLAEFIWANSDIAKQAGVKWLSLQPAIPQSQSQQARGQQAAQAAQMQVTIALSGGYFQVLDYLIRLEKMRRTVIVERLSISPGGQTEGELQVSLTAKLFTTKPGLPWTPSDKDLELIYPPSGPSQRGQIPGPPEQGCTPPQPGFSYGQQPNELGNCSGQLFVPRAGEPVPPQPTGVGPSPTGSPASGPGPTRPAGP